MKIVQVMPEFGLAGAEVMCENLTYGLIKNGHDVVVVSLYDFHSAITDRLEKRGVKVIYLGKKPGLDFSMFSKLYRVFKTEKPDVVHMHRYITLYSVPAAAFAKVPKRIHTIHSVAKYDNSSLGWFLNLVYYHCFHTVPVALSEEVSKTVIEAYHIKKDKVPIVYNGIDLSNLKTKETYKFSDKIKLLHIGRFIDVKNHKGLIEAFEKISKEFDNAELQLIGEGQLIDEIKAMADAKKLTDKVQFIGAVDECFDYLNKADMFVFPSICEGMPMTLIEAMGTGLPIVTTNVGGIPDMVDDGCAVIVEPDANKISDAVIKLIKSESEREKLGNAARQKSTHFSSEFMAKNYEKIYLS